MDSVTLFKNLVAGREFSSITDFIVALNKYKSLTGFDFKIKTPSQQRPSSNGLSQQKDFSFEYACKRPFCSAGFKLMPQKSTLRVIPYGANHCHPPLSTRVALKPRKSHANLTSQDRPTFSESTAQTNSNTMLKGGTVPGEAVSHSKLNSSNSTHQTPPSFKATTVTASTTTPQLPIQQKPPLPFRRIRDELDPAPHHTAADIRVLEILKRIRDSGSIADDEYDPPPPKRRPGRNRGEKLTTPGPLTSVLPQPGGVISATESPPKTATVRLETIRPRTNTNSTTSTVTPLPPLLRTPLKTESNSSSSSSGGGGGLCGASKIVLGTSSVTTMGGLMATSIVPQTTATPAPVTTTTSNTATVVQQQQKIGLEIILPNGLRIPVSATCAQVEPKLEPPFVKPQQSGSDIPPLLQPPPPQVHLPPPPPPPPPPTSSSSSSLSENVETKPASQKSILSTVTSASAQQVCSCTRSKCLKLYCDCFAAGRACGDSCNCRHCYNNLTDDISKQTRDVAVRTVLSRNPLAFKSKIENSGKHVLGCRCKRSHCMKGYCECYLAKIPCNQRCRCLGCSNEENTPTHTTATRVNNLGGVTNQQVAWLASLSACQSQQHQVVGAPSTMTANIPRTIALSVPFKTISSVGGNNTGQQRPLQVTPTNIQSLLLQPSYVTDVSGTTAAMPGQNLLKCLNTVQLGFHPQRQMIIPNPVQGNPSSSPTTAGSSVSSQLLMEKLKETGTPSTVTAQLVTESTPNVETSTGEVEEYSGYTEEELAFMQRLQEDRNTVTSATQESDGPSERPEEDDDDNDNYGLLCPLSAQALSDTVSQSLPPATPNSPGSDDSRTTNVDVQCSSLSAPPSLCPQSVSYHHVCETCCHTVCSSGGRSSNGEVDFLLIQRKVNHLESQVGRLTRIIQAQGSALRSLASKFKRPL